MAELCPGERARVIAARNAKLPMKWILHHEAYVAYAGSDVDKPLFSSPGHAAFVSLWEKAELIYKEPATPAMETKR